MGELLVSAPALIITDMQSRYQHPPRRYRYLLYMGVDNKILLMTRQALCPHLGHGGGVEDGGGGGAQAHVHLYRGHVLDTCRVEMWRYAELGHVLDM